MTVDELAAKYIWKTERVLGELEVTQNSVCSDSSKIDEVLDEARRYLEDAKYYLDKGQSGTSLASVAYCEGLLDALRMLGLVKFDW
ncbi:DUF357 domain-containing protein [Candidatus Bathyarchaeota archaeon]|nr:DUF357 domain-containing protein [Candidatus Bathyarchaeota archaeon]RLI04271.1 MAG: hypothetical protein DRO22_04155 [Candidatus Bathyarchaeota archaeon]